MTDDPLSAAKDLFSEDAQEQLRLDVDRLMQGGNRALTAAADYGNDATVKPAEYGPRKREFEPTTEIIPRLMDKVPPLFCTLFRKSNGTRSVTVSEGRVAEYRPKHADANDDGVVEHEVTNIWDGTLLREHAITVNQVVGIAFNTDVNGYKTGDATVSVRNYADRVSTHYTPPVGADSEGAPGDVFVILAQLVGTGDAERLVVWEGGSNVEYVHDTQPFGRVDGSSGEDIFDRYDIATGKYRYLGVRGADETEARDADPKLVVTVKTVAGLRQDLVIDWTNGPNLNLVVRSYTLTQGPPQDTTVSLTLPSRVITIEESGAHKHFFSDTTGYGSGYGTFGYTGTAGDGASVPDGAHSHTFTIPAETVSATISLPGSVGMVTDSDYYTVCFRDRLYHSVVAGGGELPEAIGVTQTKTIHTPNMSNQFDLSDPDSIENSYLTILL